MSFIINFVGCMRFCMVEKGFNILYELKEGDRAHLDY